MHRLSKHTSLAQEALVRVVDEVLVETELTDKCEVHWEFYARLELAILETILHERTRTVTTCGRVDERERQISRFVQYS